MSAAASVAHRADGRRRLARRGRRPADRWACCASGATIEGRHARRDQLRLHLWLRLRLCHTLGESAAPLLQPRLDDIRRRRDESGRRRCDRTGVAAIAPAMKLA